MIDPQLADYIKECKKNGMFKEEITNNLTQQGWPVEKINEALNTIEVKTPRIINVISTLFIILGAIFIISSLTIVFMLSTLNKGMVEAYSMPFLFLKNMPILGLLSPITAIMSVFMMYAGLKVKTGSRFSFWLGISTLLGATLFLFIFGLYLQSSLMKIETILN